MEKIIELVDEKKGIMRITTADERFYIKQENNAQTGLPEIAYRPSITWKAGYCPKGYGYIEYVNRIGLDNATKKMTAAGSKGSRIHQALQKILQGFTIDIRKDIFVDPDSGENKQLAPDEVVSLTTAIFWLESEKPEILATELVVWNDTDAGQIDFIARFNNKKRAGIFIVDWKTSKYIWNYHRAQLSRYRHSNIDYKSLGVSEKEWQARGTLIVQVGYERNKDGYKVTEIEDEIALYNAATAFWGDDNANSQPYQKDLPLFLKADYLIKKEG